MRVNYLFGLTAGGLYILATGDGFRGAVIGLLWVITETLLDIYNVVKDAE